MMFLLLRRKSIKLEIANGTKIISLPPRVENFTCRVSRGVSTYSTRSCTNEADLALKTRG